MKFQIDTSAKTIKLEQSSKIGELIDLLQKMIPDEWREYSLETNVVINWTSPVVYREPYIWRWQEPWYEWPKITCGTSVYNIEATTHDTKIYAIN